MKFEIKAYNLQELGQRANQEDSLFPALGKVTSGDRLFVLCDGMGGHEKGEVASATVCEQISRTILSQWRADEPLSDDLFRQALAAAYDALDAKDDGAERKMGTTMTFLCLHAKGATVAHIGDSRVYQLRSASKHSPAHIVFHTRDHSLVNDLVKIGEITEEEALHHPQKNVITRAMQPCQEQRARADIAHLTDIQPGDYFYMCSDGMLEQSTDENILNIITKPNSTDEEKLEMLRSVTEENKDNHTAHIIHINKVERVSANIAPGTNPSSEINGAWVTPDLAKSKKKRKLWSWLLGVLVVAVIAIASFFLLGGKSETKEVAEPDSIIKANSGEALPTEHKQNATKKDKLTHHAVKPSFAKPTIKEESKKPKDVNELVRKKNKQQKIGHPIKSNENKG